MAVIFKCLPSAILDIFVRMLWTTQEEYLTVFITMTNLAGIL